MKKQYNREATAIMDISSEEIRWVVPFTRTNPEREDCIECDSEGVAWRLKRIWDSVASGEAAYR